MTFSVNLYLCYILYFGKLQPKLCLRPINKTNFRTLYRFSQQPNRYTGNRQCICLADTLISTSPKERRLRSSTEKMYHNSTGKKGRRYFCKPKSMPHCSSPHSVNQAIGDRQNDDNITTSHNQQGFSPFPQTF